MTRIIPDRLDVLRPSDARSLSGALLGSLVLATSALGQTTESFKLLAGDGAAGDQFGWATAVSGGRIAVGAPHDEDGGITSGSAYVVDAHSAAVPLKLLPNDPSAGSEFGHAIAIQGDVVVVGARLDDASGADSGAAYLFDAGTGAQITKLLPTDGAAGDEFGFAVAINGGVVAVGAKRDDDNGTDSGSVYLFDASSGAQITKLSPDDGAPIATFGESVALDAGVLAVGAHGDDENGLLAGAAYLFDVATGTQLAKLLADDGGSNDFFGTSIAMDGGVVVVGAWADSLCFDHSGSAYLFDVVDGTQLRKLVPSDCHDRDHFGLSVAIDAGLVAIGADGSDDGAFNAGAAYLFDAGTGTELTKILASDGAAHDNLGTSVAVEGTVVAVGAYRDDDLGDASGAVYVVDRDEGVGTRYCFGDGSGASCPCGNTGDPGAGCANSSGSGGSSLGAYGSASVSSDDLVLRAVGSRPLAPGLFFQGTVQTGGGQGVVFGDGLRCVGGAVVRLELVFANAQGVAESQVSIATRGSVMAGQTLNYQWWHRDPPGPCGSGFNLSSAVQVVWTP